MQAFMNLFIKHCLLRGSDTYNYFALCWCTLHQILSWTPDDMYHAHAKDSLHSEGPPLPWREGEQRESGVLVRHMLALSSRAKP